MIYSPLKHSSLRFFLLNILMGSTRKLTFEAMTQAVANILSQFEHLSHAEQQELRRAIVAKAPMTGDLTDDDFAALAAESFRALDDEENASRA